MHAFGRAFLLLFIFALRRIFNFNLLSEILYFMEKYSFKKQNVINSRPLSSDAKNESIHYTNFAVRCIRLFICTIVLSCINKGTFIYLQAIGKPLASTLLSVLREVVFGVGLVILLPIWFKLDGLLYFMALSDILTFIATFFALIFTFRRLNE